MELLPSWLCQCWRRRSKEQQSPLASSTSSWNLFIDLKTLEAATDNFSDANLLGEGGFGPVYKGVMGDGQEIAVKKLSLNSRQGVQAFTNEVRLLLKVQHRNLVSLLGCCPVSGQYMLVYPYFPNRSLDYFLFTDKRQLALLDWPTRFAIIVGVAKGLLYLHKESPVKIIHRDIKASNILLDDQLNPKIADFGMARLFEEDATHVNTFKISGTYGYMAPEYAINGYLSAKADVFSFGVLVLEIVSGRKNLDRHLEKEKADLLKYTWNLLGEGKQLEIVDPLLFNWDREEATICITIAMLCCQSNVSDRPDMCTVHLMLSSDSFTLPKPGPPGIRGRIGRWAATTSSSLTGTTAEDSSYTGTDTSSASIGLVGDYTRNSISVSFTTVGR